MRYYAGIGSRVTPRDVLLLMTSIASRLEERGFHLRSGGALGADTAFADGVRSETNRTIYVPWKGFEGLPESSTIIAPSLPNWDCAELIAEEYHPAWDKCTQGARKLLGRNCYQILGDGLHTPVEFVICWTRSATREGGTGQALRVARGLDPAPPIYDLREPDTLESFRDGWLPS